MSEFNLVAMGGTFDIIHKGHIQLLSKAFSISSKVIIGLTSDDLAKRKGKNIQNPFQKRFKTLKQTIKTHFPNLKATCGKCILDFYFFFTYSKLCLR